MRRWVLTPGLTRLTTKIDPDGRRDVNGIWKLGLATLVALLGCIGLASPASAGLYWSGLTNAPWTIQRAGLDGAGVDSTFAFPSVPVDALAADADYVYWAGLGSPAIGRAAVDGSTTEPLFVSGISGATAIAVDDQYVYWAAGAVPATIGRVELDGSNPNPSFISTGTGQISGLAVDGQHVFWAKRFDQQIGRASIDGGDIDEELLTGIADVVSVASDGQHLFWTTNQGDQIGRASIDGTGYLPGLVATPDPLGIAHHAGYLYWTSTSGAIGRAAVDGSNATAGFLAGALNSKAIAAAADPVLQLSADVSQVALGSATVGSLGPPSGVELTNAGTGTLRIDRVRATGSDPADFLISRDDCSRNSLRPGDSCTVAVRFGPTGLGSRDAALSVESNAPGAALEIALGGTGTAASAPPSSGGGSGAGSGQGAPLSVTGIVTSAPSGAYRRNVRSTCSTTIRRVKRKLEAPVRNRRGRLVLHRWVKRRTTRCVRRVSAPRILAR